MKIETGRNSNNIQCCENSTGEKIFLINAATTTVPKRAIQSEHTNTNVRLVTKLKKKKI